MKDDTISRQAALTALNGCTEIFLNNLTPTIYKTDAVEAVTELPSAQPECEDAVSRFEVLRLIDYSSNDLNDSVDNWYFQGKVKELPSVTPKQPGWIPVTERLPQNGYWLWSANGGEVKKDFYWNGHWELAEKYGYEVLAWMPLPTPYREGGQA